MAKYKLTMNDIEREGGIAKLERDGFNREQIHKTMYKEMQGASKDEKTEVMSKLYDRQKPC